MNRTHTAESMSIGKRITLAAVGAIGAAAAALGLPVVQHPASAAAIPGTIAASYCPLPPSNNGKPGHLPQVVSSSKCGAEGSVSGPGGGTRDPDDGTIDAGDGTICVGYEIDRGCHEPV
jgi:hypothetical protein